MMRDVMGGEAPWMEEEKAKADCELVTEGLADPTRSLEPGLSNNLDSSCPETRWLLLKAPIQKTVG